MKILVTGASGFIGSYIVEEALRQGMETWAAVRPTSSRIYLQDERIHFINLNLSSEEELEIGCYGYCAVRNNMEIETERMQLALPSVCMQRISIR